MSETNGDSDGAGRSSGSSISSTPVTVSLKSLYMTSLPSSTLTSAFGPSSLGIIIVKDLPPHFAELRARLLQYASYLAHLPAAELAALTVPSAKYLTGWSHGVETLDAASGKKDALKGSWYANCAFYHERSSAVREGALFRRAGGRDAAIAELAVEGGTAEQRKGARAASPDYSDFPEYTSPNVWPAEDLLPGFRRTMEDLCCLIIDVAVLVARQCDRFAVEAGIDGYERGYLERVVSTSKTTKARLLHYFPPAQIAADNNDKEVSGSDSDDWCTTHKDHGCLTGLTSALFVDEADPVPVLKSNASATDSSADGRGQQQFELPQLHTLAGGSPDPDAGLYIRSRTGDLVKVSIPPDCLAFQTGEALERVTGGRFAAVPHLVRGPKLGGAEKGVDSVARNTLAVFTQPNLGEHVDDKGTTFAMFAREIIGRNTVTA